MKDAIGEIMRKIRVTRNFSQEFVSERTGIDYTTYSRYERGETAPKFETIVALCDLYKMTLDEFYNYGNPDFKAEEPKSEFIKNWVVPITIPLDGTEATLEKWINKLKLLNAAI